MKPILFNTEMVQAILYGRKTVTRRIIKNIPEGTHRIERDNGKWIACFGTHDNGAFYDFEKPIKSQPCKTGDILYVRETWLMADDGDFYYRANESETSRQVREALGYKWSPSIHMPKEASRIFLRVTSVRAERLQEITAEQATREGIKPDFPPFQVDEFIDIWNSTVKKADFDRYSWLANPWVWVIEFERCEKPVEYSPW